MLKNEVLNVDGTNWFVREAVTEGVARSTIAHARVTGSIGGKDTVQPGGEGPVTVLADVVRLNDDGTECLPYGEKGGTDHSELVAAFQQKGIDSGEFFVIDRTTQAGRALLAANLRNRVRAGALDELAALAETDLPLYHDAAFLRSEILRITAEAKATIAAAKAGSAA